MSLKKNKPTRTRREALLKKRGKSIDGLGNELFQMVMQALEHGWL